MHHATTATAEGPATTSARRHVRTATTSANASTKPFGRTSAAATATTPAVTSWSSSTSTNAHTDAARKMADGYVIENTNDAGWARAHVDAYVRSCRLFDVTNHPIAVDLVAMTGAERRRFFKSSVAPHASLEIVVTDPRWIAHLKRGQTWETAAYDALF